MANLLLLPMNMHFDFEAFKVRWFTFSRSVRAPRFVLSFGRRPGTRKVTALARNPLQSQHALRTFFTNALSQGTQYCSLTAATVSPASPWRVSECTRCINFFVKGALCGRYIGWLPWILPLHTRRPCSDASRPKQPQVSG